MVYIIYYFSKVIILFTRLVGDEGKMYSYHCSTYLRVELYGYFQPSFGLIDSYTYILPRCIGSSI